MHPGLFDQANEAIRFAGMSLGLPRYVSGGVGRHNVRKMDLRGVYRQLDKYVLQLVASGPPSTVCRELFENWEDYERMDSVTRHFGITSSTSKKASANDSQAFPEPSDYFHSLLFYKLCEFFPETISSFIVSVPSLTLKFVEKCFSAYSHPVVRLRMRYLFRFFIDCEASENPVYTSRHLSVDSDRSPPAQFAQKLQSISGPNQQRLEQFLTKIQELRPLVTTTRNYFRMLFLHLDFNSIKRSSNQKDAAVLLESLYLFPECVLFVFTYFRLLDITPTEALCVSICDTLSRTISILSNKKHHDTLFQIINLILKNLSVFKLYESRLRQHFRCVVCLFTEVYCCSEAFRSSSDGKAFKDSLVKESNDKCINIIYAIRILTSRYLHVDILYDNILQFINSMDTHSTDYGDLFHLSNRNMDWFVSLWHNLKFDASNNCIDHCKSLGDYFFNTDCFPQLYFSDADVKKLTEVMSPILLSSATAKRKSTMYPPFSTPTPTVKELLEKLDKMNQASSNSDTVSMKSEADYYIFAISAKTKEYMSLYRQYPYLNPRYLRSVYFMTLSCLDSAHKHLVMSLTQESLCFIRCFFSLLPRRLSSYLLCKELQISNCVPYVMRDVIYPELLLDEPPGAALSGSSSGAVPATGFGNGDHDSSGTRIPEGTGSTERLFELRHAINKATKRIEKAIASSSSSSNLDSGALGDANISGTRIYLLIMIAVSSYYKQERTSPLYFLPPYIDPHLYRLIRVYLLSPQNLNVILFFYTRRCFNLKVLEEIILPGLTGYMMRFRRQITITNGYYNGHQVSSVAHYMLSGSTEYTVQDDSLPSIDTYEGVCYFDEYIKARTKASAPLASKPDDLYGPQSTNFSYITHSAFIDCIEYIFWFEKHKEGKIRLLSDLVSNDGFAVTDAEQALIQIDQEAPSLPRKICLLIDTALLILMTMRSSYLYLIHQLIKDEQDAFMKMMWPNANTNEHEHALQMPSHSNAYLFKTDTSRVAVASNGTNPSSKSSNHDASDAPDLSRECPSVRSFSQYNPTEFATGGNAVSPHDPVTTDLEPELSNAYGMDSTSGLHEVQRISVGNVTANNPRDMYTSLIVVDNNDTPCPPLLSPPFPATTPQYTDILVPVLSHQPYLFFDQSIDPLSNLPMFHVVGKRILVTPKRYSDRFLYFAIKLKALLTKLEALITRNLFMLCSNDQILQALGFLEGALCLYLVTVPYQAHYILKFLRQIRIVIYDSLRSLSNNSVMPVDSYMKLGPDQQLSTRKFLPSPQHQAQTSNCYRYQPIFEYFMDDYIRAYRALEEMETVNTSPEHLHTRLLSRDFKGVAHLMRFFRTAQLTLKGAEILRQLVWSVLDKLHARAFVTYFPLQAYGMFLSLHSTMLCMLPTDTSTSVHGFLGIDHFALSCLHYPKGIALDYLNFHELEYHKHVLYMANQLRTLDYHELLSVYFFKTLHSDFSSTSTSIANCPLTTAKIHSPTDAIDVFKQIKSSLMQALSCSRTASGSAFLESLEMACTRLLSSFSKSEDGAGTVMQNTLATSLNPLATLFTHPVDALAHTPDIKPLDPLLAAFDMSSLCSTPYDEIMLTYITDYFASALEKPSTRTTVLATRPIESVPDQSAASALHSQHTAVPISVLPNASFGEKTVMHHRTLSDHGNIPTASGKLPITRNSNNTSIPGDFGSLPDCSSSILQMYGSIITPELLLLAAWTIQPSLDANFSLTSEEIARRCISEIPPELNNHLELSKPILCKGEADFITELLVINDRLTPSLQKDEPLDSKTSSANIHQPAPMVTPLFERTRLDLSPLLAHVPFVEASCPLSTRVTQNSLGALRTVSTVISKDQISQGKTQLPLTNFVLYLKTFGSPTIFYCIIAFMVTKLMEPYKLIERKLAIPLLLVLERILSLWVAVPLFISQFDELFDELGTEGIQADDPISDSTIRSCVISTICRTYAQQDKHSACDSSFLSPFLDYNVVDPSLSFMPRLTAQLLRAFDATELQSTPSKTEFFNLMTTREKPFSYLAFKKRAAYTLRFLCRKDFLHIAKTIHERLTAVIEDSIKLISSSPGENRALIVDIHSIQYIIELMTRLKTAIDNALLAQESVSFLLTKLNTQSLLLQFSNSYLLHHKLSTERRVFHSNLLKQILDQELPQDENKTHLQLLPRRLVASTKPLADLVHRRETIYNAFIEAQKTSLYKQCSPDIYVVSNGLLMDLYMAYNVFEFCRYFRDHVDHSFATHQPLHSIYEHRSLIDAAEQDSTTSDSVLNTSSSNSDSQQALESNSRSVSPGTDTPESIIKNTNAVADLLFEESETLFNYLESTPSLYKASPDAKLTVFLAELNQAIRNIYHYFEKIPESNPLRYPTTTDAILLTSQKGPSHEAGLRPSSLRGEMTMSTHALGSTNYYDIHNQDNLKADQLRSWEAPDSMMISMCSAKSDHVAFNLKLSYLIEHVTCFISSLRLIDSIKTILNYILSKLNTVGNLSPFISSNGYYNIGTREESEKCAQYSTLSYFMSHYMPQKTSQDSSPSLFDSPINQTVRGSFKNDTGSVFLGAEVQAPEDGLTRTSQPVDLTLDESTTTVVMSVGNDHDQESCTVSEETNSHEEQAYSMRLESTNAQQQQNLSCQVSRISKLADSMTCTILLLGLASSLGSDTCPAFKNPSVLLECQMGDLRRLVLSTRTPGPSADSQNDRNYSVQSHCDSTQMSTSGLHNDPSALLVAEQSFAKRAEMPSVSSQIQGQKSKLRTHRRVISNFLGAAMTDEGTSTVALEAGAKSAHALETRHSPLSASTQKQASSSKSSKQGDEVRVTCFFDDLAIFQKLFSAHCNMTVYRELEKRAFEPHKFCSSIMNFSRSSQLSYSSICVLWILVVILMQSPSFLYKDIGQYLALLMTRGQNNSLTHQWAKILKSRMLQSSTSFSLGATQTSFLSEGLYSQFFKKFCSNIVHRAAFMAPGLLKIITGSIQSISLQKNLLMLPLREICAKFNSDFFLIKLADVYGETGNFLAMICNRPITPSLCYASIFHRYFSETAPVRTHTTDMNAQVPQVLLEYTEDAGVRPCQNYELSVIFLTELLKLANNMPDLVQSFSSNINKFYIVPIITRLFSLCIKSNHYNTLVRFTERRSEFSKVYSAISSAVAKDVHLNNLGQWKLNDRFTKNLSADFLLIEAHLSFSQRELMKPTMCRLLGITSTDWLPDFSAHRQALCRAAVETLGQLFASGDTSGLQLSQDSLPVSIVSNIPKFTAEVSEVDEDNNFLTAYDAMIEISADIFFRIFKVLSKNYSKSIFKELRRYISIYSPRYLGIRSTLSQSPLIFTTYPVQYSLCYAAKDFFANALSTEYKDSYRETYDSLEYLTDSRATGLGLPINHFPKKKYKQLKVCGRRLPDLWNDKQDSYGVDATYSRWGAFAGSNASLNCDSASSFDTYVHLSRKCHDGETGHSWDNACLGYIIESIVFLFISPAMVLVSPTSPYFIVKRSEGMTFEADAQDKPSHSILLSPELPDVTDGSVDLSESGSHWTQISQRPLFPFSSNTVICDCPLSVTTTVQNLHELGVSLTCDNLVLPSLGSQTENLATYAPQNHHSMQLASLIYMDPKNLGSLAIADTHSVLSGNPSSNQSIKIQDYQADESDDIETRKMISQLLSVNLHSQLPASVVSDYLLDQDAFMTNALQFVSTANTASLPALYSLLYNGVQQDPLALAAKDARRHALSFLIQHGLTSTDLLHTKIVEYQRTEFSNKIDKLLEYIIDTRKLDRQNTNKVQRQDLCVEIYKVLGFRYLDSEFINRLILSACVLALDCSLPLNYAGSSPPCVNPQKRNNSISRKPVVSQSGYFAGSESNIPAKGARKSRALADAVFVDDKTSSTMGTVCEGQASSTNTKQQSMDLTCPSSISVNMTHTLPELDLPNPLCFNIYSIKSIEARDSVLTHVISPAIYAQLPLLRYIIDRFVSFISSTLQSKYKLPTSVDGVENDGIATSTLLTNASPRDRFYYTNHFNFLLSTHFNEIKAVDHLLCLLVNSAILVRETSINTAWEALEKSRNVLMQQCIVAFYTYLILEHHAPVSMCTPMGKSHGRLTIVAIGKVIASLLFLDIRTLLYSGFFLLGSCHRLASHFPPTGKQYFNSLIRVVRSLLLWLEQDGKIEMLQGHSSLSLTETESVLKAITSTVVHISRKTVGNKERKRLLSRLLFNIVTHTLAITVSDFSGARRSHSVSWKIYGQTNGHIHPTLMPNKCLQYEKVYTNTFERIQDDAYTIVHELLQSHLSAPKLSAQYISLIQGFSSDPDNSEIQCNVQRIEFSSTSYSASLLSEEVVSRCIRDVYYYDDEYTYIIEMCTCIDAFTALVNPKDRLNLPINTSPESQKVLPLNHPILYLWGPSPSHNEVFLRSVIYSVEILRIIFLRAKCELSFMELFGDFIDVLYNTAFQGVVTTLLAVESLSSLPDDFLERKSKLRTQLPTARHLVEVSTQSLLKEGVRSLHTDEAVRILTVLVASGPMYEVPAALILLEVIRALQIQSLSQIDRETLTKRYSSPLTEAIVRHVLSLPEGKTETEMKINALGSISRILAHCFDLPPSAFSHYNLP